MKKPMASVLLITLISVFPIAIGNAMADTNSNVQVELDGKMVNFPDAQPEIVNGRTMVPIRILAETLDATVTMLKDNSFIIDKGSSHIQITWNSNFAEVNGKTVYLVVPAYIKDNRTYVPLRFISESFDATIAYDNDHQKVIIDTFDPANKVWYSIDKVYSGDTFGVTIQDNPVKIRLIGIDTPKLADLNTPGMQYSYEAWQYLKSLLKDQKVYVKYDLLKRDSEGNLLAYAYLMDGTFVNAQLVKEGYARVDTMENTDLHSDLLNALLKEAQTQKIGVWSLYTDPWQGKDVVNREDTANQSNSDIDAQALKSIKIAELNLKGQYVMIVNNGKDDFDMSGWKLISSSSNQTFIFPQNYTLASGSSVVIASGFTASNNPPSKLLWTNENVWNTNSDTAILYNGKGQLVSSLHQSN